jgi:uncharacterized protein with HEPN domain
MPLEPRDPAVLWDMLQACRDIIAFVKGKTEEDYARDVLLRSAVERQVEIIGEAARRVSEGFRHEHPEVPWAGIVGQRNVLSHGYDQVDNHRIWLVAVQDVPALVPKLEALVPETPPERAG